MNTNENSGSGLLLLISKYRSLLFLILIASAFTAILNTSLGAILKWLIESASKDPVSSAYIFMILFSTQRLLLPLCGGITTFLSNSLSIRVENDIRKSWYGYILGLDSSAARGKNSGEQQKKLQDAISSVRSLFSNTLRSTLSISLEFISIVLFTLFLVGLDASLILIICGAIYSSYILSSTKKRIPMIRNIAEADAATSAFMHDSFINPTPISPRSFSVRARKHEALLTNLALKKTSNSLALLKDSAIASILCGAMAYASLYWFYASSSHSIGITIMLSTGLAQMIAQINMLGFNYRNILHAKLDIQRISLALFSSHPKDSNKHPGKIIEKGKITYTFRNLKLLEENRVNIRSISGELIIRRGFINVVNGESGIGKTSLSRIIRGEITPHNSEVLLCGADISHIDRDYLLQKISYNPQESNIYNESIRDNISYGNINATDTEIADILSAVGLDKFTSEHGLNFIVGEKGGLISGGERQRLGIARSLLQDSDLIILDEPFSGLDETSSKNLASLISKISQSTCVLVIMHQDPYTIFRTPRSLINISSIQPGQTSNELEITHE